MVNIKPTTIFSKIPFVKSKDIEREIEDRKLSYWLEKLHIQGEEVRKDNNRREEQAKLDVSNRSTDKGISYRTDQMVMQSGINAYTRDIAVKNEADMQIVNDLVKKSNRRIISISSTFPWNIFPNTIHVEEGRVTFKFNQFFASQSHSVDIRDISNVFIESSMFFATLQVVSRTYIQNDIKVGYLNKNKAIKVQRIIEGLRTFTQNNINTSNYEIDELVSKIEEFHTNHRE